MTGHGEFAHPDAYVLCPYRYNYRYVKQDGWWAFAHRDHAFIYAVPFESMPGLPREDNRVRWPGAAPAHAEWRPRSI